MRTRLLVLIFLLIFTRDLCGQCLTGFEKLLPDPTKNYSENFGSDIAIFDDIMVIGAPHSDSLARIGGIAYLFKKENSEWKRLGVLKPLVPKTALQFGSKIKITANYILIGSSLANAGVYIYRKPATGWETMTETSLITQPGTTSFGFSFDLSDDQQTLVISDMTYATATGGFYVYHKTPTEEWNGAIGFQYVPNPNKEATDFAFGGVKILNNKIACASNFGLNGKKTI